MEQSGGSSNVEVIMIVSATICMQVNCVEELKIRNKNRERQKAGRLRKLRTYGFLSTKQLFILVFVYEMLI